MSSEKPRIIYALIATGVKPLVGYSAFTGTFDQICISYLKNIGPGTSAAVKLEANDYFIFYLNEGNITYLIMTDSSYPKATALGCLESIKKEFAAVFQGRNLDNEESFGLNNDCRDKLKMKYDYYNEHPDTSNEAIDNLKEELNKMKDEVVAASGLLDQRGDKLQVLDEKAEALSKSSNNFYQQSKRVRRAELMKKLKLYGGIACAVLIILYFLISLVCGSFTFNC